jgi:glutamate dehydrogenase/leucine dehydrogenase
VGAAIPLESAGPITMTGTSFTYTFSANGTVTSLANPAGTAFQLENSFQSNTITVSGVGNVSTSSP